MTDRSAAPNTIPWPPLILLAAIIGGVVLDRLLPGVALTGLARPAGFALIITALALDIAAMITMHRAKTTILPHKGSDALVTHGIFSLSRNPIYVANVLIIVGLGLAWSNIWMFLTAAIAVFAMQKLAIEREEAHLQARFGEAFSDYRRKTRRWL